jgi:hypothetical protein
MKKLCVVIILYFFSNSVTAQKKIELELGSSLIFIDKLGKYDEYSGLSGWAAQNDIVLWTQLYGRNNFKIDGGLGFSNMWTAGASLLRLNNHYLPVKFRVRYGGAQRALFVGVSNYFRLDKRHEAYYYTIHKERFLFSNVELGMDYRLSEKWKMIISSSFTIYPILDKVLIKTPPSP